MKYLVCTASLLNTTEWLPSGANGGIRFLMKYKREQDHIVTRIFRTIRSVCWHTNNPTLAMFICLQETLFFSIKKSKKFSKVDTYLWILYPSWQLVTRAISTKFGTSSVDAINVALANNKVIDGHEPNSYWEESVLRFNVSRSILRGLLPILQVLLCPYSRKKELTVKPLFLFLQHERHFQFIQSL